MRGLLRCTIITRIVRAALIAGPVLLAGAAEACEDQYPSCLLPNPQGAQEQTSADDAPAAATADAPALRAAPPRHHRKSRRTAERRTPRPAAAAPAASETAPRDPDAASIATLPWWQPNQSAHPSEETPAQATASAWIAAMPRADDASAAAAPAATVDGGADPIPIADANEINEIDLAATDEPAPADTSWLHGLLAVLGGALAAGSAARLLLI